MYSASYKRYVTGLLLVIYIFNQTDRAIFAILMEPIKRELALSDTQLGFLAGPAMALFYATLGVPIARWADRSHRINIMSGAIVIWSTIVMLSAAAAKFSHLTLARIGVGIGEAGFSAIAQSVLADYHSPAERTRAISTFMLAIPLAGVVSSLVGGWINEVYGWRAAFIAAGLPGIILAVLLKITVKEPPRGLTTPTTPAPESRPSLRAVLSTLWRKRALRHLALAMALLNLIAGGVLGWQATFFIRVHGMSTGELGTWLAFNAGVGGGLGIWLSGRLVSGFKVESEAAQTKVLAATAALAWVMLVAMLLCSAQTAALLLALLATALANFFYAPSFSLAQGLCAANMRATILAMIIFLQLLFAGVVGFQATGILSDAITGYFGTNALRWAMIAMTPAALWAAVHFWLAGRSVRADLQEKEQIMSASDEGFERRAPCPNRVI